MTQGEFKAWTNHTAASRYHWQSDPIAANRGGSMYYMGGADGRFITIDRTGKLQLGTYAGAVPHIGEAIFTVQFTKQFSSRDAAEARVLECGGVKFLTDVAGFRCYTA